jgi:hypothetical protein
LPAEHLRQVVQLERPAEAVNLPLAQAAHVMSLDAVATAVVCSPLGHAARTCWHALPSVELEKVVVPSHAPHTRSITFEPAAVWPSPAGQVRHAAQAWLPDVALNVPDAHVLHSRLDDACGAAVSYVPALHTLIAAQTRSAWSCGAVSVYWPLGHVALCVVQPRSLVVVGASCSYSEPDAHRVTAAHAAPSLLPEKVEPCTHAAHTRSAVAEPALVMPEAAGHVFHAAHELRPALAVNVPSAHAAHTRLLLAVATAVTRLPASHGARTFSQTEPSLAVENVLPAVHVAHWRSVVAVPAATMPEPTGHVDHVVPVTWPSVVVNDPSATGLHTKSLPAVAAANT